MAKNTRPRYARSHAGCTSPQYGAQWSTARCGFALALALALALPATATTATAGAATIRAQASVCQLIKWPTGAAASSTSAKNSIALRNRRREEGRRGRKRSEGCIEPESF
ncbi:hypothetical protein B296_00045047 [Ensete ventricosum]|uniref:Uncharacterized protein n=1 Tax=Ensete ventricosum TaxID=4639 RepID=A0A426YRQ8_ENSVE|nr:hypothetical protein B296_00045047 [Ensete ventricosum]